MIRRILSLTIALVASVLGYFALWTGGTTLAFRAASFRGAELDLGAVALVVLGVILVAVAALTVAVSSLGVIVVGAVHLLVGLVSIVSPSNLLETRPITYQLFNELFGREDAINYGFYTSVPTGVGATVGAILLVAGIAARGRLGAVSTLWRIISTVAAALLGLPALLLVLGQGMVVYSSQLQRGSWDANPLVISLMLFGLLLIAAVVLPVRWSSAGAIVLGGILAVAGILGLFQPIAISQAFLSVSRELSMGLLLWSSNGSFLLIGVVLVAIGFGARTRGRRRLLATLSATEAPAPGPYATPAI